MNSEIDFCQMDPGQAAIGHLDEHVYGYSAPYIAIKVWEESAVSFVDKKINFRFSAFTEKIAGREIGIVQFLFTISGSPLCFQLLLNVHNQDHRELLRSIQRNGFLRIRIFQDYETTPIKLKIRLDITRFTLIERDMLLLNEWPEEEFNLAVSMLANSSQLEWCLIGQQNALAVENIVALTNDTDIERPICHGASYPSPGCCIYCGKVSISKGTLTKEHIIPTGLKGTITLQDSSCTDCNSITSKFEDQCLRHMFQNFRLATNITQPDSTTIDVAVLLEDGTQTTQTFPLLEAPALCLGFRLPIPRLFSCKPPSKKLEGELIAKPIGEHYSTSLLAAGGKVKIGTIHVDSFCKMLAKIAYSYAVAILGLDGFVPLITDFIRGKCDAAGTFFVGGSNGLTPVPVDQNKQRLHQLAVSTVRFNGVKYVTVSIQLFSMLSMPWYLVVVGECN